jgi:hypothetical protein
MKILHALLCILMLVLNKTQENHNAPQEGIKSGDNENCK